MLIEFFLVVFFYFTLASLLKRHLFFLFVLWFGHFWMALSSAYIESGIYITEQQCYSYPNGATLLLLFFELLFWIGICCGASFFSFKIISPCFRVSKIQIKFFLFFIGLVLVLLLLNLWLTGPPLFNDSLTRFNYWENSKIPQLKLLFGDVGAPFLVMLGVIFANSCEGMMFERRFSLFLFLVFLAYYFLIGQKFSMQFLALCLFASPVLFVRYMRVQKFDYTIKHVVTVFCIFLFLLLMITFNYSNKHASFVSDQGGVLKAIYYRILGLQGHVWWGIADKFIKGEEIACLSVVDFFYNSMPTLMYAVSPVDLVDAYLRNSVRFTMGYPAIVLYAFGLTGTFFFQFVIGVFIGIFVVLCERLLLTKRILSSIFSLILLNNFLIIFNMGDFSPLVTVKFVVPVVILFFLYVVSFIRNYDTSHL